MAVPNIDKVIQQINWHGYFDIAGSALMLWDYLLTFNDEVEYIWRQPKTRVTLLFTINRYLIFVQQVVTCYGHISNNVSLQLCIYMLGDFLVFSSVFSFLILDLIILLCVGAMYSNSKKLLYPLLLLQLLCVGASISVLVVIGAKSNGSVSLGPSIHRCTRYTRFSLTFLFWIPVILYQSVTLSLVLKKLWDHLHNSQTSNPLMKMILKKIMVFLGVLLSLALINCILSTNPDPPVTTLLNSITAVIVSLLGNRMLFSLRAYNTKNEFSGTFGVSGISLSDISGEMQFEDGINRSGVDSEVGSYWEAQTRTQASHMHVPLSPVPEEIVDVRTARNKSKVYRISQQEITSSSTASV
ncbi:hypothetical protein D9758_008185 [Tetrapyrgos nigripes]|uniref:DUF6533 domain-containing protein n=1 Tax=Tetrapyrgos nigripes TaxID=182062 RepID=A0A8H5LPS6_9AGAR|nr:hypothetical protein D9758_008185 [Tetrapyrgos nigripes]